MNDLRAGDRVRHRRKWITTGTVTSDERTNYLGKTVNVRWDNPHELSDSCWVVDLIRVSPLEELAREADVRVSVEV